MNESYYQRVGGRQVSTRLWKMGQQNSISMTVKFKPFFFWSKVKFKPGCGIVRKWAFIGSGWCYVSAERSTPMM